MTARKTPRANETIVPPAPAIALWLAGPLWLVGIGFYDFELPPPMLQGAFIVEPAHLDRVAHRQRAAAINATQNGDFR